MCNELVLGPILELAPYGLNLIHPLYERKKKLKIGLNVKILDTTIRKLHPREKLIQSNRNKTNTLYLHRAKAAVLCTVGVQYSNSQI